MIKMRLMSYAKQFVPDGLRLGEGAAADAYAGFIQEDSDDPNIGRDIRYTAAALFIYRAVSQIALDKTNQGKEFNPVNSAIRTLPDLVLSLTGLYGRKTVQEINKLIE